MHKKVSRLVDWLTPSATRITESRGRIPNDLKDFYSFLYNEATKKTQSNRDLRKLIIKEFGSIKTWVKSCLFQFSKDREQSYEFDW